jgi:hypothetical protein
MDKKLDSRFRPGGAARIAWILLLALAPAAGLRAQTHSEGRQAQAMRPAAPPADLFAGSEDCSLPTPVTTHGLPDTEVGMQVAQKPVPPMPLGPGYMPLPVWPGSVAARAAQLAAAPAYPPAITHSLRNDGGLRSGAGLLSNPARGMNWMAWPQSQSASKPQTTRDAAGRRGSPGHIFWVIPAFKVDYAGNFQALTAREKFDEWAQSTYDPMGFGDTLFEAGTLEYSSKDGFCGYGRGWGGYGECFGSLELDATDSSFIGDFALAVLLHQDPRYFRLGKGSFGRRLLYAVSRVFVTYTDSGRTVVYTSTLSGTFIAAGLSNFYYPSQDVGWRHTMTRVALDLGNTALYNSAAEFWPDIKRKLDRVF